MSIIYNAIIIADYKLVVFRRIPTFYYCFYLVQSLIDIDHNQTYNYIHFGNNNIYYTIYFTYETFSQCKVNNY